MKKYFLQTQTLTLLILLVFFSSCNGQVKTNTTSNKTNEQKTIATGQPKIIKTHGTGSSANVHCGLKDKAGNIWFGTTGEGVYRYDGELFTNFTVKDGLSNNFVWSIFEDKTGNLWFGTSDGACRYNGKNFTSIPISVIKGSNLPKNKISVDSYGNPSEENAVWDIFQDKNGKFWFGTTDGVYRYDGMYFTRFLHNDSVINNSDIQIKKVERILEDKTGNIWFSGRNNEGVFRFDGKSLTSFKPDGKNWLWPVLEDQAGNIWFSNWSTVYRYDGKTFTNLTKRDDSCNNGSTCMMQDKNGNIWCGNDGANGGLCRYDGKSFTHFTTKEGLINNSVWCIVEDKAGNLWVGTRGMGLCRYDGEKFTGFSE